MKVVKKILMSLFLIIFIPLIIINICIITKAIKYPSKIPDFMGYKPMIVMSNSMESVIDVGDVVIVKEVDTSTLKRGDIVAYRIDDVCITHRIAKVNSDGTYITKGDNNNALDDEVINKSQIEGIYVTKIKGLGHLLLFLKEPLGLAVVLMGILLVGVTSYLIIDKCRRKVV